MQLMKRTAFCVECELGLTVKWLHTTEHNEMYSLQYSARYTNNDAHYNDAHMMLSLDIHNIISLTCL